MFGAAAAACRMLEATEEQTLYALAIAANQASGVEEFLVGHSWTKRLHPGWSAHAGIVAAMLAKKGFWGERSAIEGDLGFYHAYFNTYDLSAITDGLGETFDPFLGNTVKYFSCCGRIHTALDAELRIMTDENLKSEDVISVLVALNTRDVETLGRPEEMRRNPPGRLEAQFSIPYCIAAALADGELTLKQFTPESIASPAIRAAIDKVTVVAEPAYDSVPDSWPGRVTITTKDGRSFTKEVVHPPGSRENPLTWDQLVQKFMAVGSLAMGERQLAELADHLATVEDWPAMTRLTELLRA